MVNLNMTKCLYAMVTHCRYTGDPRTGWNFPPTNSPKYNAHLLGIKVACGLEILVARANDRRKREGGSMGEEESWRKFLGRLEDSGYFRGTIQGSEERERRTKAAREYLQEDLASARLCRDDDAATRILEAWKCVKTEDFEMLGEYKYRDQCIFSKYSYRCFLYQSIDLCIYGPTKFSRYCSFSIFQR